MALLYVNFFSYTYLLLVSLALINSAGMPVRGQDLIADLCNKCRDPIFCTRVLGTDPRTRGAGLIGLAEVAIDLASTRASNMKNTVHTLRLSATSADIKFYLGECEASYEDVLYVLRAALGYLKKGDFHDVNTSSSEANDDVVYCEKALNRTPSKSQFTKENNDLQTFADMIAVASNLLGV